MLVQFKNAAILLLHYWNKVTSSSTITHLKWNHSTWHFSIQEYTFDTAIFQLRDQMENVTVTDPKLQPPETNSPANILNDECAHSIFTDFWQKTDFHSTRFNEIAIEVFSSKIKRMNIDFEYLTIKCDTRISKARNIFSKILVHRLYRT